jgi:hypothetical protein
LKILFLPDQKAISYQSYILIMFGINNNRQLLTDVHVLDVSNLTQPTWLSEQLPNPSNDDNNKALNGESRLSTGAIAGIVVAAVVAAVSDH